MRDQNGFPRRPAQDAQSSNFAIIGDGENKRAARSKSRRAARQARIDSKRVLLRVDIPPSLKAHLEKIANDLNVPVSQLANRLIWEGLENLTFDQLKSELKPSKSMRYTSALPYPGDRSKNEF